MADKILIGDFVKLTKSTMKTVLYYQKIGLLKEPDRNKSRYRLYGLEELECMRRINYLKELGLNLSQIREVLEVLDQPQKVREVLIKLNKKLLNERMEIDMKISKVKKLLDNSSENIKENSELFDVVVESLDEEQIKDYKEKCPELFKQQEKVFGKLDEFKEEKNYNENFKKIGEYFKNNPEKYKIALELGKNRARVKDLDINDPEIDKIAREGAEFIKNDEFLKSMLYDQVGFEPKMEGLFNEASNKFLTASEIKHKELIQKYLKYNDKK